MGKTKKTSTEVDRKTKRAETPEARENQMIALAVDLAEKQLTEGTASAQVITHYLKLATTREKIEKEILEKQKDLITAKTDQIKSQATSEELYAEALAAMKRYRPDEK